MASLIGCDWSLGGHSLLKGVTRQQPWQTLEWSTGASQLHNHPLIAAPEQRLEPGDTRALAAQRSHIVDSMLEATRRFVEQNPTLRCSLTAGLDSRGVLALLVGAGASDLDLFTNGNDSSRDVRVARQLARLVGARHTTPATGQPSDETLRAHNRLRAFAMDGTADARRAMASLPRWNATRPILVGGAGGEIFRGFFYQYFGSGTVPDDLSLLATILFKRRFRRLKCLRFADPGARDRIVQRLRHKLGELQGLSASGHDMLDLLYLYERYGHWGAVGDRTSWTRRWTPYETKPAIAASLRLPAPIGERCTIIPEAIRRFLPTRAYLTPVNGLSLLPLEGPGRVRSLLRQALDLQSKFLLGLERKFESHRTHHDARAQWIVNDYARQLLESPHSLARDLFGRDQVQKLIDEQERAQKHTGTLAYLLNAEEFRCLTRDVTSSST